MSFILKAFKKKTVEKESASQEVYKDTKPTYPLMDWELFEKTKRISKRSHKAVDKGTKKVVLVRKLQGVDCSPKSEDDYDYPEKYFEHLKWQQDERRKSNERLKKIKHPCLVEVYGYYMDENQVDDYLVFEYVWGRTTLRMLIDRSGPMSENDVQITGNNMLVGLTFLENHKVIYRNFYPWNVLFDYKGNVKLSDYGVVEDYYGCPYEESKRLYLSCETIHRGHSNFDMYTAPWGFGVMVFEMLYGKVPFTFGWLRDAYYEEKDLVVYCPEEFSENAKSLLRSMLFVDGYKGVDTTYKTRMKSFVEAQKHPFFSSNSSPNQRISCFDWSKFNVLLIYHSRKYFPKQSGIFEVLPMDVLKKIIKMVITT